MSATAFVLAGVLAGAAFIRSLTGSPRSPVFWGLYATAGLSATLGTYLL